MSIQFHNKQEYITFLKQNSLADLTKSLDGTVGFDDGIGIAPVGGKLSPIINANSSTRAVGIYNVLKQNYVNSAGLIRGVQTNQVRSGKANGNNNYRLCFFGDSTFAGFTPSGAVTNAYQYAVPTQVAQLCDKQLVKAGYQSHYGDTVDWAAGGSQGVFSVTDPRVSNIAGGWNKTVLGANVFCSSIWNSSTSSDTISFAPMLNSSKSIVAPTNTIDFNIIWNTGYDNTLSIKIDGTTATSVTGAYTNGQVCRITGTNNTAVAAHTYQFVKAAATSSYVYGWEAYDNNNAEISFINCSNGGTLLCPADGVSYSTFSAEQGYLYPPNPSAFYLGIQPLINNASAMQVDGAVISYGINHWDNPSSYSVGAFQANLDTVVAAFLNTAGIVGNSKVDVWLVTPPPSPISNASIALQAQYIQAYQTVALKYGIILVDPWNYFGGTNVLANSVNWMALNNVHDYVVGQSVRAQLILDAIKAIL